MKFFSLIIAGILSITFLSSFEVLDVLNKYDEPQYVTYSQLQWKTKIFQTNSRNLISEGGTIEVGCEKNKVVFQSISAIASYLPDNTPASKLQSDIVDPKGNISALLGEIMALKLNILANDDSFGTLKYNEDGNFFRKSIIEILYYSEKALGDCFAIDTSEIMQILENINNNFSEGADHGYLEVSNF